MTLSTPLSGIGTAVLAFELESNAGTEAVYFDSINFVPEPGSLALLVLGGLALLRRR